MKKIICVIMGVFFYALTSQSQSYDTTSFYGKMNYLYANINKTPITTGLLRDYGIDLQNLDNYTGLSLHDSNYTSLTDWRMLYSSLYSQQITSTSGLLYLDTLNKRFSQYGIMGDPISFVTMYYNYQTINPDGVNNNQFYISNNQLYDVNGRSGNPYLTNDLFAIATTRQKAITGDNQFIFRNDLFFGNTGKTISSIQIDAFGTGNYQTVSIGNAFTIHYNFAGLYNVNVQITYTDNTVKYGHTKLAVHVDPASIQARYGTGFTPPTNEEVIATRPYLGILGEGDITIDLARDNNTGEIRRPLIVVEGFDPDDGFRFNSNGGLVDIINRDINNPDFATNAITLNNDLDDISEYDLIFLNWQNGTDYIQRNAFLLQRVIEIVNDRKTVLNGVRQDNIIIGLSMGGLVVRYALRDMEQNNIDHETRLFISHDAPHNGANVPVGYQALVQYIEPWKVINAGGNFPFIQWTDMFPDAVNALNTFNSPAAKQMLIQRYLLQSNNAGFYSSLSYTLASDNTVHNSFMTEINNMGWPVNCRNVTLSNGSCNGSFQFDDNSKLMSIYGEKSWTYFGGMWRSFVASIGGIINITQIPTQGTIPINNNSLLIQLPLSLISTKTNLFFDFGVWPVPQSAGSILFKGDVYLQRKLFWGLFTTNTYILKCNVNAASGMLALDNAPGGVYDLNEFGFNIDEVNQQLQDGLGNWITATVNEPRFCFVPTVSSLAFDNPTQYYRSVICDIVNCHNPAQVATYFAPQLNQLHVSYTQNNTDWIFENQNPASNCMKVCPNNLVISGNNPVCTSEIFTLTGLPNGGIPITWTALPRRTVSLTTNGNQATIVKTNNGPFTLSALIEGICGRITPLTIVRNLTAGPLLPYISGPFDPIQNTIMNVAYTGEQYYFMASEYVSESPAPTYTWTLTPPPNSGGNVSLFSGSTIYLYFNDGEGNYTLNLTKTTSCGANTVSMVIPVQLNYGFRISASPNPTSDVLNVTINNETADVKALKKEENIKIDLIDFVTGTKRRSWSYKNLQNTFNLSVANLPKGQYLIQVSKGKYKQTKQIIVN